MNKTLKWVAVAVACALAWAVFLATSAPFIQIGGLQPPLLEPLPKKKTADFSWPLVDMAEKPVDLAQFKGRPIVLNVWATWCNPCLEEMPSIARLADNPTLQEKGVVFLCVSTDASHQRLQAFLKNSPWKMTILRATSMPDVFATEGIPATFVIAPDGEIVTQEVGASRWDDQSVVDYLVKLAGPAK